MARLLLREHNVGTRVRYIMLANTRMDTRQDQIVTPKARVTEAVYAVAAQQSSTLLSRACGAPFIG
jgi:hypothetical protein